MKFAKRTVKQTKKNSRGTKTKSLSKYKQEKKKGLFSKILFDVIMEQFIIGV